jgi:hypothetical protein
MKISEQMVMAAKEVIDRALIEFNLSNPITIMPDLARAAIEAAIAARPKLSRSEAAKARWAGKSAQERRQHMKPALKKLYPEVHS